MVDADINVLLGTINKTKQKYNSELKHLGLKKMST